MTGKYEEHQTSLHPYLTLASTIQQNIHSINHQDDNRQNEENKFTEKKLDMEQTRLVADIILRSLESVQKIGQIVGTAIVK